MKILYLFVLFSFSAKGPVRIARWRELRKSCLDKAYEGQKRGDEAA